ncbi:hypothetical protein HK100_003428 [Physocladia obscura]|uniref:Uncharacterized protein n=1 Tax=Physocladia obscura TaxID=109957 RepID=A0AAD5SU83_9FUNG|nr:hypothetical protein HK100_003428 [Physocladia obscura]
MFTHSDSNKSGQILLKFFRSINEILTYSDWILILQEGALLADADPSNMTPFSAKLDAFTSTNQLIILFEHCNQTDSGSLLIHTSLRDKIKSFADSFSHHKKPLPDSFVWPEFLKTFKTTLSRFPGNDLFTCESFWLDGTDVDLNDFDDFTVNDRICADSFRLIADFYLGDMPLPAVVEDGLKNNLLTKITKDVNISDIFMRDGSVIFVDAWSIVDFINNIAPQINTRYVLISGDGDGCAPKCELEESRTQEYTSSPFLLHWYVMNCDGIEAGNGKISCLPIGLSQWQDKKEMMQVAYNQKVGLKNGLEWKLVNLSQKHQKYVLASFRVESNPQVRQPVYDLFCNNTSNQVASVANCQFGEVDQLTFYWKIMAESRFVISPPGLGLDCYRTYESIFMNVIPVVVKSSLDSIYDKLPVLILDRWEDLTIELMEETEKNFTTMKFDFRKLYVDYWYHKYCHCKRIQDFKTMRANFALILLQMLASDLYRFGSGRSLAKGEDPFNIEKEMRISVTYFLHSPEVGVKPNDMIIMADVDEIPSRNAIQLLRSCDGVPNKVHLRMRNYLYSFDFMQDAEHWRPKVVYVPSNISELKYTHSKQSDYILSDADFVFKMTGYAHADRVHNEKLLDPERIQKVICDGTDIFEMLPEAYTWKDLAYKWGPLKKSESAVNVPSYLIEAVATGDTRFNYLLPGGCKRNDKA